ncbi:hypothetical protein BU14_0121s0016 [Porphyra umbilicalis]|uniref:Uncharacterized protein n=1 Tax=Porphyra umbilicalis TaxID=2786 RepID=A0A1X6PB59_PORUM|nr:hypothetical protein BU14_0121s0016 [Porphyra umbilicalis]|eukprot:OSX78088.1 hypothetical protein BU14_0121s0016 [Porphyra umbilicalis]
MASHWALYRGRRTGDKKRRTAQNLLNAFTEFMPEQDRPHASMRSVEQLDKKLKALRASLVATRKEMEKIGNATQDNEDAAAAFGGQALYELPVSACKDSSIFTEDTDASDDLETVTAVRGGRMGRAGASVAVYTRRRRGHTPSGGSSRYGSTTGARRSGAGGGALNVVAHSGGGIPAGEADAAHETTRSGACTASAPDMAAAAGPAASASVGSKSKRPRKETAASVLREYVQTEIDAEEQRSARDAEKRKLDAETHTDSTVTENDLRRAMVGMFNAYVERARRQ